MENKDNVLITPLHKDILKEFFQGSPEYPTKIDYKNVRITNSDDLSLSGFLVGSSIAIPIRPQNDSEVFVQKATDENWKTYLAIKETSIIESFFHFLKTPINTTKMGFHTLLSEVKGAFIIHIYPEAQFKRQEDFIEAFTKTYKSEGFEVSIEDPSR